MCQQQTTQEKQHMAIIINLTGEPCRLVDDETDEEIVFFPPSPDHEPVSLWLDMSDVGRTPAHRVVVDGLITEAKPRVKGLRFKPEPGVTYIVSREAAWLIHGHEAPFAAVYGDGGDGGYIDDDGVACYTTFVRLVEPTMRDTRAAQLANG